MHAVVEIKSLKSSYVTGILIASSSSNKPRVVVQSLGAQLVDRDLRSRKSLRVPFALFPHSRKLLLLRVDDGLQLGSLGFCLLGILLRLLLQIG